MLFSNREYKNTKNGLCKATKSVYSSFILSEELRACFQRAHSLSVRSPDKGRRSEGRRMFLLAI